MRPSMVAVLIPLLLNLGSFSEAATVDHSKIKHPVHTAHGHPLPPKDLSHFPEEISEARIFQIPDDATLPSGRPPPELKPTATTTNALVPSTPAATPPAAAIDCTKDPQNTACYTATIQARPVGR